MEENTLELIFLALFIILIVIGSIKAIKEAHTIDKGKINNYLDNRKNKKKV